MESKKESEGERERESIEMQTFPFNWTDEKFIPEINQLSVVQIYPQHPWKSYMRPMNYRFTVAAILASAVHFRGSTE